MLTAALLALVSVDLGISQAFADTFGLVTCDRGWVQLVLYLIQQLGVRCGVVRVLVR